MTEQQPKMYDIYGVEYNPWFLQSWFIYSVIGCVALLISYVLYRWYRARKKSALTYTQRAMQDLDLLEKSDWSNHKQFYIQLTTILKEYLQKHYGKNFVGATDSECLQNLQTDRFIPESIATRFEELTEGVMFVKFANAQTAQERMQKDLDHVKIIITTTSPKS